MKPKTTENQIAIQLKGVTKEYTIHHEKPTLVEKFYKGKEEKFLALDDISLTIRKGERVGIIGPNGSGKTTLLKIIAGITTPTKGTIQTFGKVVSLIDLEAGFHPDLTGYQNIFLNGMLIGMKKKEIEKKLYRIIDFADIRQFIDAPMFTYSSGMALRLGFAIAVHAEPAIIILDEGLGVGDNMFQKKSQEVLLRFSRSGKTIMVVSHSLYFLKKYVSQICWFEKGKIREYGNSSVISHYLHDKKPSKS